MGYILLFHISQQQSNGIVIVSLIQDESCADTSLSLNSSSHTLFTKTIAYWRMVMRLTMVIQWRSTVYVDNVLVLLLLAFRLFLCFSLCRVFAFKDILLSEECVMLACQRVRSKGTGHQFPLSLHFYINKISHLDQTTCNQRSAVQ